MSMVSFLDYGNYKLATFLLMFLSQHQIKTIAKNVKQVQLQSETENCMFLSLSQTNIFQYVKYIYISSILYFPAI